MRTCSLIYRHWRSTPFCRRYFNFLQIQDRYDVSVPWTTSAIAIEVAMRLKAVVVEGGTMAVVSQNLVMDFVRSVSL